MKIFWIISLSALVPGILFAYFHDRRDYNKRNVLYYPQFIFWLALIGTLVFVVVLVNLIVQEQYEPLVGMVIPFGFAAILFWLYFGVRVTFTEECWFLRSKRFEYTDIRKIVFLKSGGFRIFFKKKRLDVELHMVNYDAFLKMLKKKKVLKNAEVIRKDDK